MTKSAVGSAIGIIAVFCLVLFVLPQILTIYQAPEADLASSLASQIAPLPTIDDQACPGVSAAVTNTMTVLQDMDHSLGTGFGPLQFDASNCDIVLQYLPVLGTYNSLIRASRSFDPKNVTSVRAFYEDAFLLSSDFIIINDRVSYDFAFKSTGEMNDALELGRLRSICGDECYRVVLSGIHWTIRVYMNQFLCQFETWASQYLQLTPFSSC